MDMKTMMDAIEHVPDVKGYERNAFDALEASFLYHSNLLDYFNMDMTHASDLTMALEHMHTLLPEFFEKAFQSILQTFTPRPKVVDYGAIAEAFIRMRVFGQRSSYRDNVRTAHGVDKSVRIRTHHLDDLPKMDWPHYASNATKEKNPRTYAVGRPLAYGGAKPVYDDARHMLWEYMEGLPFVGKHLPVGATKARGQWMDTTSVLEPDSSIACDTVVWYRTSPVHSLAVMCELLRHGWLSSSFDREFALGDTGVYMRRTFDDFPIDFDKPLSPLDIPLHIARSTERLAAPPDEKTIFHRYGMVDADMPPYLSPPVAQFIRLYRPVEVPGACAHPDDSQSMWDFI